MKKRKWDFIASPEDSDSKTTVNFPRQRPVSRKNKVDIHYFNAGKSSTLYGVLDDLSLESKSSSLEAIQQPSQDSQIFLESPTASDQQTYQHKNSCHFGWDLFEGKCYFFSGIEKTWDESRENCAKSNSHLAVINNRAELVFLMKRARSVNYFIGLTKRGSGEEWRWVDNTMYDPDMFHMSVTDFNCAVVGMNILSSTSCSVTNYWVCEET